MSGVCACVCVCVLLLLLLCVWCVCVCVLCCVVVSSQLFHLSNLFFVVAIVVVTGMDPTTIGTNQSQSSISGIDSRFDMTSQGKGLGVAKYGFGLGLGSFYRL